MVVPLTGSISSSNSNATPAPLKKSLNVVVSHEEAAILPGDAVNLGVPVAVSRHRTTGSEGFKPVTSTFGSPVEKTGELSRNDYRTEQLRYLPLKQFNCSLLLKF